MSIVSIPDGQGLTSVLRYQLLQAGINNHASNESNHIFISRNLNELHFGFQM